MIKKIGIIGGSGKMGSSFKNAFEKLSLDVIISDKESNKKLRLILDTCDWIILCVPIDKTFICIYNEIKVK